MVLGSLWLETILLPALTSTHQVSAIQYMMLQFMSILIPPFRFREPVFDGVLIEDDIIKETIVDPSGSLKLFKQLKVETTTGFLFSGHTNPDQLPRVISKSWSQNYVMPTLNY